MQQRGIFLKGEEGEGVGLKKKQIRLTSFSLNDFILCTSALQSNTKQEYLKLNKHSNICPSNRAPEPHAHTNYTSPQLT